jgi:anti-sigma regulatory factor (Ser/Thr protein kinase)
MKHTPLPQPANSAAAALTTILLLGLCTWLEVALDQIAGIHRPYTIFYLIPVAVGAAFFGVRGGVATAFAALLLARIYVFSDAKHGLALVSFPSIAEAIEFGALLLGTIVVAVITGRLRTTLSRLNQSNGELQQSNAKLIESEEQRRVFNRDVLLAVTGGKLRLVDHGEIPPSDLAHVTPVLTLSLTKPADATELRHALSRIGQECGMDPDRIGDLCTATTEAATNAIKHGNGGQATVWSVGDAVTVQIADNGSGIAPAHLARATLEQGFSTRVSLGMGFHLMLQSTDTLALCTDIHGTTVFLQVSNKSRPTIQESVLARYANVA